MAPATCPANAKKANLDFTVTDMNGASVKLSSFKGKVILLDFWATWCPPCKAEIPGFVELQEAYRDKGLQVVGVSVDDTPDKLKPFASEYKMNYPVLVGLERDDLQDAYWADVGDSHHLSHRARWPHLPQELGHRRQGPVPNRTSRGSCRGGHWRKSRG